MMKKYLFYVVIILLSSAVLNAQSSRVYNIGIQELQKEDGNNTLSFAISEEVSQLKSSDDRGLGLLIYNSYRTLVANKINTGMNSIVDNSIQFIKESIKNHRSDWMKSVLKECTFTKDLKMIENVSDFYQSPSSEGAFDLHDIIFRGFSCNQYIKHISNTGDTVFREVFDVQFQLDTTINGIQRMIQHSKFQVQLKSIVFNPYLCEIPNDSTDKANYRIPLDFEKRKDFTIRLKTTVKSSWINEAIQVHNDQKLGEFILEIKLDPNLMDKDSCFRYDINNPGDSIKLKNISLMGESFMVPRSYIGKIDGVRYWGTGEYRLEMLLSETCKINERAYMKRNSSGQLVWDNRKWKQEWKIIQQREKDRRKNPWNLAVDRVKMTWRNGEWITEIITPCTNVLLKEGHSYVNKTLSVSNTSNR